MTPETTTSRDARRNRASRLLGDGKRGRWTAKRVIALAMMMIIPAVMLLSSAGSAHADEDDENAMKYSFYKVASAMTSFFSSSQAPEDDEGGAGGTFEDEWNLFLEDPGSAGSLLGYLDPDFSFSAGWLNSQLSGSSDAIGYDTLVVREDDGQAKATNYQGLIDYAYFGATLKGLGLDGTSTGLSLGFFSQISGGIVMFLYILSGVVDWLFQSILSVLALLNPFKLFYLGVKAVNPTFANGMTGGSTNFCSSSGGFCLPLDGLMKWVGGWYQVLNSMAWTVMVPIFMGTLALSLLLFKNMNRGGAIKKLLIRLLFIGLGLPLLGSMYTGMINAMSEAAGSGNAGSTRVVMSTYVDFESWALKSRLAIPEGAVIEWDANEDQPTGKAHGAVRNTALGINNQTHELGLEPVMSSDTASGAWSDEAMKGGKTEYGLGKNAYNVTMDMLARYIGNAQLSSASFETQAKGNLNDASYYETNNGDVKEWFENFSDEDDLKDKSDDDLKNNPVISVERGSGLRGSAVEGAPNTRKFSSKADTEHGTSIIAGDDASARRANLAPLAMYNYLNTDFGSSSMTMYSSGNVMSEATRSIHNSVNQVGTGIMGFFYWFNTVVLLGAFVTIGFGYALSMLFSNFRRSFQLITAIPFATLGAMSAIAKVVVYAIALILEVIVTIFLYKFVQEFLISLPQIIEMPFSKVLNTADSGDEATFVAFLLAGTGFTIVVTVLSIVGVILFTVMAMRLRKTLVKAIEETVTKIVEKFTDTSVGSPGGGGKMAPAMAGGLAAGAGSSAANRMMSGGGSTKSPTGKGPNNEGKSGGPEGIDSAGGTIGENPGGDGEGGGKLEIEGGGQLEVSGGEDADGTGSGIGSSGGMGSASDDTAMGREVEANGLSPDGGGYGNHGQPAAGDDAMDSFGGSAQSSIEGYQDADMQRVGAGKDAAAALGHAGIAAGRAAAGDEAGAVESGGKAVEKGGSAVAKGEQAKQTGKEAGQSKLDGPADQKHAKKAQNAQQVSQAGSQISGAAGMASGVKGGQPGSTGKASSAAKPASSGGGSKAMANTPSKAQRSSAPQRPSPAPKQAPPAPAARPIAPKPVPAPQAPAVRSQAPKAPKQQRPTGTKVVQQRKVSQPARTVRAKRPSRKR